MVKTWYDTLKLVVIAFLLAVPFTAIVNAIEDYEISKRLDEKYKTLEFDTELGRLEYMIPRYLFTDNLEDISIHANNETCRNFRGDWSCPVTFRYNSTEGLPEHLQSEEIEPIVVKLEEVGLDG